MLIRMLHGGFLGYVLSPIKKILYIQDHGNGKKVFGICGGVGVVCGLVGGGGGGGGKLF